MRRVAIFILCLASPAFGQGVVTDAFGIRSDAPSPRDGWSGWVERLDNGNLSGASVAAGPGQEVLFYLGEKSLTAGGRAGQAAALILDALGNLVADGTEVTLTTADQSQSRRTLRGIASRRFDPGPQAGQFHAGAAIDGWQSGRVEYQVQPDLASLATAWRDDPAPVLAEDMHILETKTVVDRYGNRALDGVGGEALLRHDGGAVTLVPMVTIGGVAQGQLLARDVPSRADVTLSIGQRVLAERELAVARPAALAPLKMAVELDADTGASLLTVGPFLTDAGYALNDGSPVTLRVTPRGGAAQRHEAWVFGGMARVVVLAGAADYPLDIEVSSVLGVTTQTIAAPQEVAP